MNSQGSSDLNRLEKDISDEEKQQILKQRALKLAEEITSDAERKEYIELTEFKLAAERYGIETRYIQEVYSLKDYTPLPCTPPFVFGILNIRGNVVSVIDLKKFFGLPEMGLSDLNKVIVLHDDTMVFGILADEIIGVRRIIKETIHTGMPTLKDVRLEYLLGVAEDRLVILDGEKLLTSENVIVCEEA